MSQLVTGTFAGHPMGGFLSSNQAIVASQTNAQVTPISALTGFPGTVIVSNKLVADGGQKSWTASGKVTLTGTYFGSTLNFSIMHNASQLVNLSIPNAGSSVTFSGTSVVMAPGDTLWLAYSSSSLDTSFTISSGSTSTFVQFA